MTYRQLFPNSNTSFYSVSVKQNNWEWHFFLFCNKSDFPLWRNASVSSNCPDVARLLSGSRSGTDTVIGQYLQENIQTVPHKVTNCIEEPHNTRSIWVNRCFLYARLWWDLLHGLPSLALPPKREQRKWGSWGFRGKAGALFTLKKVGVYFVFNSVSYFLAVLGKSTNVIKCLWYYMYFKSSLDSVKLFL